VTASAILEPPFGNLRALDVAVTIKVINLVPAIVPFFSLQPDVLDLRIGIPGSYRFEFLKIKNIKVQKFEILFKFAYTRRYLTENTGIVRYLVVQTRPGKWVVRVGYGSSEVRFGSASS